MGTCFNLIKEDPSKQLFDLDKGGWWNIFPKNEIFFLPLLFRTRQELSNSIQDLVYFGGIGHCCHIGEYECIICKPYFYELSERLFNWCGEDGVKLWDDCSGERWEIQDYIVTEDRFISRLFKV